MFHAHYLILPLHTLREMGEVLVPILQIRKLRLLRRNKWSKVTQLGALISYGGTVGVRISTSKAS